MEISTVNCTPQQVEEATEKKVIEKNITLGIDDISNDIEKILPKKYLNKKNLDDNDKKVLAVILHACRTKCHSELGFYPLPNRTLRNIAKVGSNSLTAITNKLKMLGLIDFEQGETRKKGKASQATRYTILFDDKLVKKSTYFNNTQSEVIDTEQKINDTDSKVIDTEQKINDTDSKVIDTELECEKVFNDTQSSGIDTSVDNQGVTEKESKKSGIVNVNLNRNRNINLDSNLNCNMDIDRNMDLDVNRNLDRNFDGYLDVNKKNKTMDNTKIEELLKKLIISIDNNTRVNTKLIESNDINFKELNSSILSLKNGKETDSSIETLKKEIEELQEEKSKLQEENQKLNKDIKNIQEDYTKLIEERTNSKNVNESNGKSDGEVKTPSIEDKILSHSLDVVTKHPTKDKAWKQEQQKKALQEAKQEQSPKIDTKTTVVENNSNNGERNYVLKKLECEIIKPFKSSIVNAKSYEKLMKTQEDFADVVKKFYTVHNDVITPSEMKSIINEVRTVFQQKEEELQQKSNTKEPSSKSNGIVQSEEDNTKELQQNPSKEETEETTAVENSSKEDEAKSNQFQSNKETTPKTENCEEKEEATAEPSTANSKNIEVSKTDTPNDKEKTQEELDKELDKTVSSMFLTDTKQTVSTKKSEEVKFPETKVIPLREGEEKRQFQELVGNTTINKMLESYSEKRNFNEILTEIRKVVTKGNYPERVVNAYIEHIWNTYRFDCDVQDAMKPFEDTKEITVTAPSTPKGDSFEDFKKSLDNIDKNAEENGSELPFGNNPNNEESNCYESEEEKVAMSASCSYDESQDELF